MFESGFSTSLVAVVLCAVAACDRPRATYVARAEAAVLRSGRIGTCASLTGPEAATGADYQRGFEQAIDQWNNDSSKRLRVELVSYDDQSRPSASAVAMQRLLEEDRVALVLCSRPAPEIATATDALIVCAACPSGTERPVIGTAPSLHERAELLAELVVKTMQLNKVAVLARRGVATDREAGDAFRASLKTRNVVTADAFEFTPETIADVLTRIMSDAPQAVLVALDGNDAALVGRAMRRRAVPSALLFFGTPNLAALPEADRVAALEGALFPGLRESSSEARMADVATERTALAFDAAWRACQALEDAGNEEPPSFRSALARARATTSLRIARVQSGQFVELVP